jgi:hypothetical protein
MGSFTFIPVWVIQDFLILAATVIVIMYILKKEEHPYAFLMEMFCFTALYAAVYENFATLMGWYGYGRSLIMIFNVPITVPLVEYLVVYSMLRLLENMDTPVWTKPILVGSAGLLFDLSLDPLAVRQLFATAEVPSGIGRWSWYIGPNDVNILGIPVYNFSGWVLLCGYAAVTILIGRYLFRRSGYKPWVGYAYPAAALFAALLLIVSPLSQFLLWLAPFFSKGSAGEWIMLGVHGAATLAVLLFVWRGRMKAAISLKSDWPLFMVLIAFHASDVVFALIGAHFEILWLQAIALAAQAALVLFIYRRSRTSVRKKAGAGAGSIPRSD